MTNNGAAWPDPPAHLELSSGDVHIWHAGLNLPDGAVRRAELTLSTVERARAGRFRFEHDRRRFVAAHGALRAILGRYLETAPEQVQMEQAPGGKPRLPVTANLRDIEFSMAHSQDVALYAVAVAMQVGIDVEYLRPMAEAEQIAARFFAAPEIAALALLAALPEEQRLEGFYTCWTAKEAYTKAIGAGLAYPLPRVEVAIAGGRLAAIDGNADEAARWFVQTFRPAPDHIAALVVESQAPRLSFWRYESSSDLGGS